MISLPKWRPQNTHFKFWNWYTLYSWQMCGPFGTSSVQDPGDSDLSWSQYIKPAGSGSWKSGCWKGHQISASSQSLQRTRHWLSFILAPVVFKTDKLLELKLMCFCDHSMLLKLTEAETDESNQFVNFGKRTAWRQRLTKSIPFLPDQKI